MSSTPFDNNGIPLTQPSQASQTQEPLEPEDNYVDSTSNDFCTRLKFWMDTVQHLYPIQLAVIYKAGVTVNLSTSMLGNSKRASTNDSSFASANASTASLENMLVVVVDGNVFQ